SEPTKSDDKYYTVDITGVAEGTATLTIKADDFEEKVTVKVVEAGEVVDYKVEGFESELFYKADQDKKRKDSMTLEVKGIDENGRVHPTHKVEKATLTVKNAQGTPVDELENVPVGT